VAMLEPTAGLDNVRATVNVSYDEGSEEKTDEVYDPAQVAALSLHKSEQTRARSARAEFRGRRAILRGRCGPCRQRLRVKRVRRRRRRRRRREQCLRCCRRARRWAGWRRVRKRGAAGVSAEWIAGRRGDGDGGDGDVCGDAASVALGGGPGPGEAGDGGGGGERPHDDARARASWSTRFGSRAVADEMKRLEELARAAVGFDATRGDQVVIENVSFSSNAPEVKAPAMEKVMDETSSVLHTQPGC
jgi:flagellar M-ring protein FliF